MNYHQRLYRTRALMDEVMTAMNNLAGPGGHDLCVKDIRTIVQRRGEFQNRLRECFYNIIDLWPDIPSNEARRFEVSTFISRYRSFRLAVRAADSPGLTEPLCESLRRYSDYLKELDEDMTVILGEFSGSLPCQAKPSLTGIAESLRRFVEDVDDEFFERLIFFHQAPSRPLKWRGSKVAAALFAKHFGLTDSEMNKAFVFPYRGKTYTGLKISSYTTDKGDDRYGIKTILMRYPKK